MAPILGIYASSITGNLSTNNFSSIATVTVGSGGTSTVTFSSIPSTYTHLQVRALVFSNSIGSATSMAFNGDTSYSSNYYNHLLFTTGSGSVFTYPQPNSFAPIFQGSTTIGDVMVLDILDYANINKYKVTRSLDGYDANGSGSLSLSSNLWKNTAAITSMTFSANTQFTQYTTFALYGIK
jgi:hypothetical protein